MAVELDDLWQKLSLVEECAEEVVVEEEWVGDLVSNGKYCLLGKLIINRASNLEAMRNVLAKAWRLKSTLTITEFREKVFVFQFEDAIEKDRVLLGQPWTFNKSLLVLNDFDSSMFPEKVNMDWCPFWVQVHGLPLDLMNEKFGIVIGETIGEIMEVETDGKQQVWGRWLRIRVNIDVSKPLKRGSKIARPGVVNNWLLSGRNTPNTTNLRNAVAGLPRSEMTPHQDTSSMQAVEDPAVRGLYQESIIASASYKNASHAATKVGPEDIVKKDVWYEELSAKQVNVCDSFNAPADQNRAGDQCFKNNSQVDVKRLVAVPTNMEVEGKSPPSKLTLTCTTNVDQVTTSGAIKGREFPKHREWAPQDRTEEAQSTKPPPPCLIGVTSLAQGDLEGPALEKPKRTWKRAKGLGTKDVSNMVTANSGDQKKCTLHEE
ncbi:hypothetical protein PTKIN_Ptkin17bG0048800 [Pterospermum kingtungense]